MSKWLSHVTLTALFLGGCTQIFGGDRSPQDANPEGVESHLEEPTLTVSTAVRNIPFDQAFLIEISLQNGLADAKYTVSLSGVAGIEVDNDSVHLNTDADGSGKAAANIRVVEKNHSSLVASVEAGDQTISDSLELVFDAPGVRLAAQRVGATDEYGREITMDEYHDSVPTIRGDDYVVEYEIESHEDVPGDDNLGNLPTTILVENVRYLLLDGGETEAFAGIEYYLPDTGGGEPEEGEVEGVPPGGGMSGGAGTNPSELSATANCGSTATYATFKQRIISNPSGAAATVEHMPAGTYVRAVDYNGILPDYILAEGFIGAGGRFNFNLPNCDTSTVFDTSEPDVFFIFETRTNNGLTASHGTFARRHWWRTATYYNQTAAAIRGRGIINVQGANSEAVYTQRIWHKVNQVRNWERAATGVSFPVDVLYPVAEYAGVVGQYSMDASRAALGQLQIIYRDATSDRTLFHEFGHIAYYRKVMGTNAYNQQHACNLSGACASFPACGGCLGHGLSKVSGPEAAMIEGWADFFESLTTREAGIPNTSPTVGPNFETLSLWSGYPTGPGSELRVAMFLWDMYDTATESNNDLVSPTGSTSSRYKHVASFFVNKPLSSELQHFWYSYIKPRAQSSGNMANYCKILRYNWLGSIDGGCG